MFSEKRPLLGECFSPRSGRVIYGIYGNAKGALSSPAMHFPALKALHDKRIKDFMVYPLIGHIIVVREHLYAVPVEELTDCRRAPGAWPPPIFAYADNPQASGFRIENELRQQIRFGEKRLIGKAAFIGFI